MGLLGSLLGRAATGWLATPPLLNSALYSHLGRIKYTGILGMVFLGGLVVVDLYQLVADRSVLLGEYLGHFLLRGSVLVGVPLLINVALFYVHFALMTQAGIHDGWLPQTMKAHLEVGSGYMAWRVVGCSGKCPPGTCRAHSSSLLMTQTPPVSVAACVCVLLSDMPAGAVPVPWQ